MQPERSASATVSIFSGTLGFSQLLVANCYIMAEPHISRPRIACEISADRIVAARAADAGANLEAAVTAALPPGLLTP
jgi:hypothetical protein